MASIASIVSFDSSPAVKVTCPSTTKSVVSSEHTLISGSTVYSRSSSVASFGLTDEHCSPAATPEMTASSIDGILSEGSVASGRSTPLMSSSLAVVLPSAAAAATAAADANRRRKVLTSRPPNSFILYRSDKLRELVQKFPELKQTQISKMCAENWKNETDEVKDFYRRKQQEAKALFMSEQALEVERISGGASDKDVIKRIQPTNTFIRYRTEMKKKLAAQFAAMNQKDVSRACGLMWRSEPEHVKMRYRQSYNKEKRNFERLCTTSSSLEPSEEALSALASVMASSVKVTPAAKGNKRSASPKVASASTIALSPASVGLDKKRRLTEGCQSAPTSPPEQRTIDNNHDLLAHARATKRLRAFYTSPRSHSMSSGTSSPIHVGVGLASIKEVAYGGIDNNRPTVGNSSGSISLPSCASLLSLADSATSLASRMPPTTAMYQQQQQQQQQSSSPRRTSFGDAFPPRSSVYAHKRQQSMLPVSQQQASAAAAAYDYHPAHMHPSPPTHYAPPPHQYTKRPAYLDQQPTHRVCAISTPSYFHSQISDTRHSSSRPHMPSRQMPLPPNSYPASSSAAAQR
ncbi:hypothetical protein IW140_000096 [Coemansia sp. RSA 1813]|nr:hypothetical protein EV178_000101 [Coemansia sp. RSA 1646]KAJ1771483.1 hypothetical protein LPJ74_002303 [Coemansia sp. RSA 1843]KAJ2093200.1 hypothetical protein IW138_000493 [Coemansia sp. RSA 986]KAJ2217535.1 hypothetical protein EV179_000369 [Coemansia sp. RSA 487]KAJ2573454.1 hypothetical protein IW140_000096 [Coemansia sp. RSA 1813]